MSPSDILSFTPIEWVISQLNHDSLHFLLWSVVIFVLGCMVGSSIHPIVEAAHRRQTISKLNERELEILSNIVGVESAGMRFSIPKNSVYLTACRTLENLGIVVGFDTCIVRGEEDVPFSTNPSWRRWLHRHQKEIELAQNKKDL